MVKLCCCLFVAIVFSEKVIRYYIIIDTFMLGYFNKMSYDSYIYITINCENKLNKSHHVFHRINLFVESIFKCYIHFSYCIMIT